MRIQLKKYECCQWKIFYIYIYIWNVCPLSFLILYFKHFLIENKILLCQYTTFSTCTVWTYIFTEFINFCTMIATSSMIHVAFFSVHFREDVSSLYDTFLDSICGIEHKRSWLTARIRGHDSRGISKREKKHDMIYDNKNLNKNDTISYLKKKVFFIRSNIFR